MYIPYTYKIQHQETGEFYIGSKYAKGCNPENSSDYYGSVRGNVSRCVRYRYLLENERHKLVKEILSTHSNKESTISQEILLHSAWFDHPLCLNGARQTSTKFRCDVSPSLGKKHSEETKRKMSISHLGRERKPHTPLTKQKISVKKLQDNHRGENHYAHDTTKYIFKHDIYGVVECTRVHLWKTYNLSKSHVAEVARGTRKSHLGWRLA